MNKTFKVLSVLLSYPTTEFAESVSEIKEAIDSELGITAKQRKSLKQLVEDIASLDLYDAQERYVYLFDRTRSLSLHLFEHVHGESRDRGQAMVDLMTMYNNDGFSITAKELPDYLPLFLEYLSRKPGKDASELLGQTRHILTALKERLERRDSIYVIVFNVLESLADGKVNKELLAEMLNESDPEPDDLESLDKIWEEEVVTFGGNSGEGACGPDRLRTQLRAFTRNQSEQSKGIQRTGG